jgi:hypothetical protein
MYVQNVIDNIDEVFSTMMDLAVKYHDSFINESYSPYSTVVT